MLFRIVEQSGVDLRELLALVTASFWPAHLSRTSEDGCVTDKV